MKNYKIIVAHPGKQHSYKVAEALEKNGNLYNYITTVYDSEKSILMKVVKKAIGRENNIRANSRSSKLIPKEKVLQFCELRGLILLMILRLDKTNKRVFYYHFARALANRFGKKVARYAIKHNVDAVVCYDTNAEACFKLLKKKAPHIVRIMDNSAVNRHGLYKEYQKLNEKYAIFEKQKKSFKSYLMSEGETLYYKNEALLTDYHIVASSFSKRMLTEIGISENNVYIIPYGIDKINEYRNDNVEDKINVLYVGEICAQKGIFDYIDAAIKLHDRANFHIVGGGIDKLNWSDRKNIEQYMTYYGYLLQSKVFKVFSKCDVFVFPSLGDGFGFVVLEAMSMGLPVICSKNTVGQDIVVDGKNGFLIDPADTDGLVEKIQYFIDNKSKISEMGDFAHKVARGYTWEKYSKSINSIIEEMVERKSAI